MRLRGLKIYSRNLKEIRLLVKAQKCFTYCYN